MICDTWYVTRGGGWTFSQNFSSLALTVCEGWWFEDLEEKGDLMNELTSDEAVCRTAPATRGLLKTRYSCCNRPSLVTQSFCKTHPFTETLPLIVVTLNQLCSLIIAWIRNVLVGIYILVKFWLFCSIPIGMGAFQNFWRKRISYLKILLQLWQHFL